MVRDAEIDRVAGRLRVSIGLLVRRLRQFKASDDLTLSEIAALARLEREGPATSAALAKIEQISPQSMGATLAALESRGFVSRGPDPRDARHVVFTPTDAGLAVLRETRTERVEKMASALAAGFTLEERNVLAAAAPLLERLAQTI
jgi:DNA-binding MarR family transcriptional regulator